MKAKVIATGVIVDVIHAHNITSGGFVMKKIYQDQLGNEYSDSELEFLQEGEYIPDYWTRLEHQAAIGAMQGLLSSGKLNIIIKNIDILPEGIAIASRDFAHTLVQKLKGKEEK